ncbi:DEAD/DEAH box helicase [Blautia sp. MSJ-19]|uniref:DEAD/DEAH box helicase n=1 Tax=Blautia sp. MSJ-19 TaxID=2841517 RepID=UPI001C0F1FEB|nr:DEAD/DEAH box helicase [Blautia sp. MSJ-19]MBU5480746.1 DEAD/DEAH box helicase [Blautia sp. MSJ-19]
MKGTIIYKKIIPEKAPIYAEFPSNLHPDIQSFLVKQNIQSLYIHQAETFCEAVNGKNIVITTPTASGKSLCFYLPVIQEILQNPITRAIFVYPTKALAADQYRALKPWIEYFGEHRLSAGVYDGDTPPDERKRIRERANIILTNPDMLNGSMLPNHSKYGFDFIFANLKYIVLDELHVYRGAFGSHLANVFRRLSRLCRYYHSEPQFLCSSATIANPVELAEKICGKTFTCISKSGAGMAERTYCLIQPPEKLDRDGNPYGKESVISVAADLLPQLMEEKESFLAFAKSRKNVEILVKETRDHLENSGFLGSAKKEEISGYRGGYTPQERKDIEKRMISGELTGLVSTNALELGIDIGKINTTVLVGYPGTRASFWQQTGRAGRGKGRCTNYLILANLPMDQYIALEPEWLFDSSSENAIVDPDNLLIELAHIRAAAAELPLSLDDGALFPDLGETIPVLLRVEEVRSLGGRFVWSGGLYPAGEFSMRNIDQNKYQLLNKETGKDITEMDEEQAFHEIHEGAVYMHDGEFYQVVHMNLETKIVEAVPFHGNYYTVPGCETNIRIIHRQKKQEWKRTELSFGDVNIADFVYMYKKMQFHNHQNLGFEQLRKPLTKNYDTEAAWIKLPENVVAMYRNLLQPDKQGYYVRNNHFEGLMFALKNAALMVTMTESADLGVAVSSNALELAGSTEEEVYLYFYDCYVGGLGFAEKIYDLIPKVVEQAVRMVSGCRCKNGCAVCIGDDRLDRNVILWGLQNLSEESGFAGMISLSENQEEQKISKEFKLEELEEKWDTFCSRITERNEAFAGFFRMVSSIEVKGDSLIFYVKEAFYAEWADMPENRTAIVNILLRYVSVPDGFRLAILSGEKTADHDKKEKMMRRYHSLKKDENNGTE